jgi:hypothetical protein
MCSRDSNHWLHRRRSGWQLQLMRLAALALMLVIGLGPSLLAKVF